MNFTKIKLLAIAIVTCSVFSISCNEVLYVDLPNFESKLVVESIIFKTDSISVGISRSVSPYMKSNSEDTTRLVHNAKVTLINDGVEYALKEDTSVIYFYSNLRATRKFSNYYVKPDNFILGKELLLKIKHGDVEVSSSAETPTNTNVKSINTYLSSEESRYTDFHHLTLNFKMKADFPKNIKNYYRIAAVIEYYRGGVLWQRTREIEELFEVVSSDSTFDFKIYLGNMAKDLEIRNPILIIDHITEEYYNFLKAVKMQFEHDESLIESEVTRIPSNIKNAYGIFTIIARDTVCFELN